MNEVQKEVIKIMRLFNIGELVASLLVSIVLLMYALVFGLFGVASLASNETAGGPLSFIGVVCGLISLFTIGMIIFEGYVTYKADQPIKWIWYAQVILRCLRLLNLAFLPINLYFLIQLLKPEYKKFYGVNLK